MGTEQPHLRRALVLVQRSPFRSVVQVAVETAQALGRAEGAALFVADGDGLAVAASTIDASHLVQASEICSGFLLSGCMTSGLVPLPRGILTGNVAFSVLPLIRRDRLMGVLYLEGLAEPDRAEGLVQKCAEVIAAMLEPPPPFGSTETWPERSTGRLVPWSDGQ